MTRCWLALGILSVLLLPQFLQRADPGHFTFVAPVVLGLLPWAASSWRRLSALTRVTIPTVVAFLVGFHAHHAFLVHGYPVRDGGRSFALDGPRDRNDLQAVIRYVDARTSPGQRIFVGPRDLRTALFADTWLYYMLPALRPATFYLEFGPGDNTASFTARISRDLKGADVLVLQSVPAWVGRTLYPYARPGSKLPNAIVARYFRLGYKTGSFTVFLRDVPA